MLIQSVSFENLPAAVSRLLGEVSELKELIQERLQQNIAAPDEIFDVKGASRFLGIAEQTTYQNIKKIPHSKRFGKLYFLRSELETYLAQGKVKTK